MLPLPATRTYEEGLLPEIGIPGFWDNAFLVNGGIGEDTVHSSTAQYKPDGPVSVSGSYTGTSHYTGRSERPGYGPRQRTRSRDRDIRDSGSVYFITPSAESVDQQVIHGTFFLSHL